MPRIYIDGRPIDAKPGQSVIQAARDHGIEIPAFCWHPQLSVSGSCRVCAVQVEGRSWVEIACNMPLEILHTDLTRRAPDLAALTDFFDRHNFGPMLRRQAERLSMLKPPGAVAA